MVKVIEKNSIRIGREPVVILPLREWKKIEQTFEEWEELIRYTKAISDPENQRLISFEEVKKKLNLP